MIMPRILSWLKEKWELVAGFFIGVFTVLFAIRKSGLDDEILEMLRKNEDNERRSKDKALADLEEKYNDNIDEFIKNNESITHELETKFVNIDAEKKEKIKELMNSEYPEEKIAEELKKLLR